MWGSERRHLTDNQKSSCGSQCSSTWTKRLMMKVSKNMGKLDFTFCLAEDLCYAPDKVVLACHWKWFVSVVMLPGEECSLLFVAKVFYQSFNQIDSVVRHITSYHGYMNTTDFTCITKCQSSVTYILMEIRSLCIVFYGHVSGIWIGHFSLYSYHRDASDCFTMCIPARFANRHLRSKSRIIFKTHNWCSEAETLQ